MANSNLTNNGQNCTEGADEEGMNKVVPNDHENILIKTPYELEVKIMLLPAGRKNPESANSWLILRINELLVDSENQPNPNTDLS